jgi:hypothetical protein
MKNNHISIEQLSYTELCNDSSFNCYDLEKLTIEHPSYIVDRGN